MHVIQHNNKKYLTIMLIWLLTASVTSFGVNVIWDLGGTLIRPSRMKSAQYIGLITSFKFFLDHGTSSSDVLRKTMFEVLSHGDPVPITRYTPKDPAGIPMPVPMQQWFKGKLSSSALRSLALKRSASYPDYPDDHVRQMVNSTFQWMFTPKEFARSFKPISTMVKTLENVVRERDEKGNPRHKLFILSNFDPDTYKLIHDRHKNGKIFRHFAPDNIFISGKYGTMKPEPAFYRALLNGANIDPKNSILIDDQKENIETAKQLGMDGIWIKDKQYHQVKKELRNRGILTHKKYYHREPKHKRRKYKKHHCRSRYCYRSF